MKKVILLFIQCSSFILAQTNTQNSNNPNIFLNYFFPIVSAVLTGLIMGYLSYRWNSKSQLDFYKNKSKDEIIDRWITEFKTCISTFMSECQEFNFKLRDVKFNSENNIDITDEDVDNLTNFIKKAENQNLNFKILLNDKDIEKTLYDNIREYYGRFMIIANNLSEKFKLIDKIKELKDNKSDELEIEKLVKNVNDLINIMEQSEEKQRTLKIEIVDLAKSIIINKEQEKSINFTKEKTSKKRAQLTNTKK